MSSCTVPGCPLPLESAHRRMCPRCAYRLRAYLRELVGQMPLLEASLQLDRSPTTGSIHGGRAHSPMPLRGDVLTLLGPGSNTTLNDPYGNARSDQTGPPTLDQILRGWAEVTAEHIRLAPTPWRRPGQTWAAWLGAYLPWILTAPWAGDFHQELGELVGRVRAITRTEPRTRKLDAPCPSCEAFGLVEEDWQEYIECPACGRLLTSDEYTAHAHRVMPTLWRTALLLAAHNAQENQAS
ncbi:ribosomal protein S27E [Streptomyces umbrinus]|uniref:hypothetical protein n=1 Tax=Streptomyces umbrinus TaxID=67370 RepID=UPI00214D4E3D|nr:hypothetical protein [Streptomyces umbrinus]MCR3732207.1 ribosomal protein S27E [Streptomyces umbrinus]